MQATVDISRAKSIGGWMSDRELLWLALMATECNEIVEFGSFHGRSTRALADNCNGHVYAVDPWSGTYLTDSGQQIKNLNTYVLPYFKQNLKDHIESGKVIVYRGFSHSFEIDHLVDMVFIDGDHRIPSVEKDIQKALSILKPNGVISGHDYNHPTWPGVKMKVDEILGPVAIEDTIWWTRK